MSDKTGGPAFPTPAHNLQNDGMTMRDYFAIEALPVCRVMMQNDLDRDLGDAWAWDRLERKQCAEDAYEMADAMLKARQSNG